MLALSFAAGCIITFLLVILVGAIVIDKEKDSIIAGLQAELDELAAAVDSLNEAVEALQDLAFDGEVEEA
jgi:hypothetical protein